MKMVKISVIVPVYNCEDYLEESIRSVLNQSFKDFEIICMDDGSTDDSLKILNQMAEEDSRIKVFTQENQGSSAARNNALKKVTGDYVYFFDGDDYIVEDCLEKAYNNALANDSDMVIFKYDEYRDNSFKKHSNIDIEKVFPNKDFNNFSFNCYDYRKLAFKGPFAPWFKFYKGQFLKEHESLEFPINLNHNDVAFHLKTILKASKISFIPENLYHYRLDNPNSISNTRLKRYKDIFAIVKVVEDFLKEENLYDEFNKEFEFFKITRILYEMRGRPDEYMSLAKEELSQVDLKNDLLNEDLLFKLDSLYNSDTIAEYDEKIKNYRLEKKNKKSTKEANDSSIDSKELNDSKRYDFKFSVVMPIYNVEEYLGEAIESLINQSIGFEENIELIIVDDESPDNSKEIALDYQEKYPNNIKCLSKPNGGQASAFNLGLGHVHGKYINFLDSDDYISSNAFEEVYDFFEEHYDEVDVVSIPIMFFERQTGDHALNFKFKSTRVIDLVENPGNPQLSLASSFVKNEALKGFEFDTVLPHGYDALVTNKILLNKKKLGVVNTSNYFYRKRETSTSLIDTAYQKEEFYTYLLKNLYCELIDYSLEKEGSVLEFIQYMIAYNIQWYYKVPDFPDYFIKEMIKEFWETFYNILSYIDEDILHDSKIIKRNHVKSFLMYLKNRGDFYVDANDETAEVYLKSGDYIINNLHNHRIYLDDINLDNGILKLLGTFTSECDDKTLSIEAVKTVLDSSEESIEDVSEESEEAIEDVPEEVVESNVAIPEEAGEVFKEIPDEALAEKSELEIRRFLGINWQFMHHFAIEVPIEENVESKIRLHVIYDENDQVVSMNNSIKFRETALLADVINYYVKDSRIVHFSEDAINIYDYSDEKAHELKQELLSYIKEHLESEKQLKKDNKSLNKKNNKLEKKTKNLEKKKKDLEKKKKNLENKNKKLENKNEKLINKNNKLKENLNKSRQKNMEMMNSTSWKITKPLRMPKQLIKKND